jgi:glycogen operon protein
MLNAYWESLRFQLPPLEQGTWRRWIDTALESPLDISPWEALPEILDDHYCLAARSVVMVVALDQPAHSA